MGDRLADCYALVPGRGNSPTNDAHAEMLGRPQKIHITIATGAVIVADGAMTAK